MRNKPGQQVPVLTDLQGEIHADVDVFCPNVIGRFGVEHGVDAAVKVRLAGGLSTAGDSDDGCTGSVPRQHVSRPEQKKKTSERNLF